MSSSWTGSSLLGGLTCRADQLAQQLHGLGPSSVGVGRLRQARRGRRLPVRGHTESPWWSGSSIPANEERARTGPPADAPLAVRMRPRSLDEVVGQDELLRVDSPLRIAIESGKPHSAILYGPPGTGKTTLARIVAGPPRGVRGGVGGQRRPRRGAGGDRARARAPPHAGRPTIFFLDEIHRFNKAQQDALLPAVEEGLLTLIGATTENPYFEVNSALLCRSPVYELKSLGTPRSGRCSGAPSRTPSAGSPTRRRSSRRGGRAARAPLRRRRADRARRAGARRRDRAAPAGRRRPRDRRGRPPAQGGALRQGGRPALRLHLGLDQGDARLGSRRVALLPRGDAGGRGGPPVPRPPDGDPRLRGRRQRRPAGARRRERRRAGGRPVGLPECALNLAQAAVYLALAPEVERLAGSASRPRTCASTAPSLPPTTCATRTTRGRGARPRQGLRVLARRARRGGGQPLLPRRSRASASSRRPTAGGRRSSAAGSRGCASLGEPSRGAGERGGCGACDCATRSGSSPGITLPAVVAAIIAAPAPAIVPPKNCGRLEATASGTTSRPTRCAAGRRGSTRVDT